MESATELSTLDLELENPGVGAEKDIRLNEAEKHPSSLAPCVSPLKCGDQSILHTCDQQVRLKMHFITLHSSVI